VCDCLSIALCRCKTRKATRSRSNTAGVLQEMPEKAGIGQLPCSVEVILEHDLVDRAKLETALCASVSTARCPPPSSTGRPGLFRTVLMCNNVSIIGKKIGAVQLTGPALTSRIFGTRTLTTVGGTLSFTNLLIPCLFSQ
jgi:DNA replicative helicase MCM subunit Mcm2 (Cdc46/Mcm family)